MCRIKAQGKVAQVRERVIADIVLQSLLWTTSRLLLFPYKFICWSSKPKCSRIWRQPFKDEACKWGHKGLTGMVSYKKRKIQELSLYRHRRKVICNQRRQTSTDSDCTGPWSCLPVPHTWENAFLPFKPLPQLYSFMTAQAG